jgi:HAMP domain-containing protein
VIALATADELAGLLRKYAEILRLRRLAARGDAGDPRRAMTALATEFPGALREADERTVDDLERRISELKAVLDGAPEAPWMHRMARFHALTRGALCAKRWLGGRKTIDADTASAFQAGVGALCYASDAREWTYDLERLASPPRGRVTELVFEKLAAELGVDIDDARRAVLDGRPAR